MSRDTARRVLEIEAEAIRDLIPRLDESFDRAVDILFACTGRVVATGMGKSGFIAQKISATLASTGTPSLFLHPAEADPRRPRPDREGRRAGRGVVQRRDRGDPGPRAQAQATRARRWSP